MSAFDLHYERWEGSHTSIWARRITIAANGLRLTLQGKLVRFTLSTSGSIGLALALAMFLLGQFLVADSVVTDLVANASGEIKQIAIGITAWLEMNPDVSVGVSHNLLFFYYSKAFCFFSLLAVLFVMPNLITQDLASSAMIIYTSKAVGRMDYLIGKFLSVFSMVGIAWFLPMAGAWVLGNFMSPRWHFFYYSLGALWNLTVVFLIVGSVISLIALALSSLSNNPKKVSGQLLGLVAIGLVAHQMASEEIIPSWLRFASLTHDVLQVNSWAFDAAGSLELARERIPMFGSLPVGRPMAEPEIGGALIGLGCMGALSVYILNRRTRIQ